MKLRRLGAEDHFPLAQPVTLYLKPSLGDSLATAPLQQHLTHEVQHCYSYLVHWGPLVVDLHVGVFRADVGRLKDGLSVSVSPDPGKKLVAAVRGVAADPSC